MTHPDELQLLRDQLAQALADPDGEAWEIAALAGLIARLAPGDEALAAVRARLDPALGGALAEAAEAACDRLLAVDEDEDPSESWDALSALDELGAAAAFLGQGPRLAPPLAQAAAAARAFPEIWACHADAATAVLRDRAPLQGDPAWPLWAAVEASRWGLPADEDEEGASGEARIRVGLDALIRLSELRDPARPRLAAADALPTDPPWTGLARGPGWELALTEDEEGAPILLLSGAQGTFSRDGAPAQPSPSPEGLRFAAVPGAWEGVVAGRALRFRIAP